MDHWRCRILGHSQEVCGGPVSDFAMKWPNFMQQQLDPKLVGKARDAVSRESPERTYRVLFWGLMQSLREKGGEVSIECQLGAGGGYVGIHLCHKGKCMTVLIELKSSEEQGDMEREANKALKRIEEKNY